MNNMNFLLILSYVKNHLGKKNPQDLIDLIYLQRHSFSPYRHCMNEYVT